MFFFLQSSRSRPGTSGSARSTGLGEDNIQEEKTGPSPTEGLQEQPAQHGQGNPSYKASRNYNDRTSLWYLIIWLGNTNLNFKKKSLYNLSVPSSNCRAC